MVKLLVISRLKCVRNIIIHKLYQLKGVPKSTYIQRLSIVSRDLSIGSHSFIAPFCNIGAGVEIGNYVMMASHSKIVGGDHRMDIVGCPMIFSGRDELKITRIEDDVWIGAGVTILSGVTVGFGSIIGAGAVVTENIEPFSINVGVPSRKVANRFSDEEDKINHMSRLKNHEFSVSYAKKRYRA